MAKKIVIVEDEPSIAELGKLVLTRSGYEVTVCYNGREAMDTIRSVKPQLVLLDIMLPGIDGHTIAKQMGEDQELSLIPIIITSALEESRGLFTGNPQIKDFVSKPFSLNTLVERVQNAIGAADASY